MNGIDVTGHWLEYKGINTCKISPFTQLFFKKLKNIEEGVAIDL